jgi:hypothetical protein
MGLLGFDSSSLLFLLFCFLIHAFFFPVPFFCPTIFSFCHLISALFWIKGSEVGAAGFQGDWHGNLASVATGALSVGTSCYLNRSFVVSFYFVNAVLATVTL